MTDGNIVIPTTGSGLVSDMDKTAIGSAALALVGALRRRSGVKP